MEPITVVLTILLLISVVVAIYFFALRKKLEAKYSSITDAESEADRLKREAALFVQQNQQAATAELERAKAEVHKLRQEKEVLNTNYQQSKGIYDRLLQEISVLEENLEDISFGLYKPHFTFDTPEQYKEALQNVRAQQKEMTRTGKAAVFATTWTVGGSAREGQKMQKQYTKLMLRAFNGECDAAVANVTWNNVSKMEERIRKGFDAINELGGVMQVSITSSYLALKVNELQLKYEFEEKKHAIADEQRQIREQMREQERAQRELERAQQEAETEEVRFQRALEKAKVELARAKGEEHRRLTERLLELETQLAEAHEKKERTKAMAELTKAGYLYIISNLGSFGNNVFKIGMTRRLDPMDRVKELGDASVPFPFDVHAMIYSDNAPALECDIHNRFADRIINLINPRKEFFNVTLDELDRWANEKGLSMYFTKLAEAREFRETMALRASTATGKSQSPTQSTFPGSLDFA